MRSGALCLCLVAPAAFAAPPLSPITVNYPASGSVFPPDIVSPTFLWTDTSPQATAWTVEVVFSAGGRTIKITSAGEPFRVGESDPEAAAPSNEPPKLPPELASARSWKPDEATWAAIKRQSVEHPATVRITGYSDPGLKHAVSRGETTIVTSRDPVGAPIFYRDVPLMPNQVDQGVIRPLPPEAVGLIKWRLRDISQPKSRVMMSGLATCANCHSFSLDGKTMGLDVDGPQNDRGLYALVDVKPTTAIRTKDVIKWPAVRDPKVDRLRASFMSQVSPNGRYVLTTIDDPESKNRVNGRELEDKYYNANFMDYKFIQVFYPTRGILAWYDRTTGRLQPLPGADDPRYVQTDGVWSPDGKTIVFARAEAQSPYAPGTPKALYANDPNETQIRYNLYRIPFNDGKGGVAEPIEGASNNGMSNNFPKVSPDGRWVVFVRCRNGQLMRPDSKLYMVPLSGGQERLMNCNTSLMNSWHSFSPNGRWLVFSSKSRSPYTQMYLTHIDENGMDSPPILIEDSTAANRAVNLPEFVNVAPGQFETIDPEATEYYRMFNRAYDMMKKGAFADAEPEWRKAIAQDPGDSKAHFNLAYSLEEREQLDEALAEYQRSRDLDPESPTVRATLGLLLGRMGRLDEAIAEFEQSLALNPRNPEIQADLGVALLEKGRAAEAVAHCRMAVEIDPEFPEAQSKLGVVLAKTGSADEGLAHLEKAVSLNGNSIEYRFNLAYVLAGRRRFADAIPHMEKAVELGGGEDPRMLLLLSGLYFESARPGDATATAQRALDLATSRQDAALAGNIRAALARYQAAAPPPGN